MQTGRKPVFYWDTCIFLAWLKDEKRPAGEMEGIKKVADMVLRDQAILVTATLTRAEILEGRIPKGTLKKYDALMRRSNVVPQSLDIPIAVLTSNIRDHYRTTDFELLTPDAIHLATAIYLKVQEFQTFDGSDATRKPRQAKKYKRCGLLALDGNVAGHALKIAKPNAQQYELKLQAPITEFPKKKT